MMHREEEHKLARNGTDRMTDIPQTQADADAVVPVAKAVTARIRGRKRRFAARLTLLLLLAPLVFALIAGFLMLGQEITAPSWVKDRIEAQATEALNGGALQFGAITVTVGTDLHPQVRLIDVSLRDVNGSELARVPMVQATLSPRGLLFRRQILAQTVTLTGAQIALNRAADGSFAVAFGASTGPVRQAQTLADLLDQFDQIFERPAFAALNQMQAQGVVINYTDARAGRSWTVDGGTIKLDLRDDRTRVSGDFSLLSGRDFVTGLALRYDSPRGSRAAEMSLTVIDVPARDIATQSPVLSWLSVLDAPLSAALRLETLADGTLGPFSAALKVGAGQLEPARGAQPISFDTARAYLDYDPTTQRIAFNQVSVNSEWGSVKAEGQAYLRDIVGGFPKTLLGQFELAEIAINPPGLYPAPITFPQASADFRLRLDPFDVQIGQFSLTDPGGAVITATGDLAASSAGWTVAIDAALPQIGSARVMELWPVSVKDVTRRWFDENFLRGDIFNTVMGLRIAPDVPPQFALTSEFRDTNVLFMRYMPPITAGAGHVEFANNRLMLALDQGTVTAPQGGNLDMAGSVLTIPNTAMRDPPATVQLAIDSSVTAALSILDQQPFHFMQNANLPVTLADGRAQVSATISLPLAAFIPADQITYDIRATLADLRSDTLVPGRVLAATQVQLTADPTGMTIQGPMRLGQVPADVVWHQDFGPAGAGRSRVEASVELSERFIDEFNIGLPPGTVSGAGRGQVVMDLSRDAPPAFTLTSRLDGIGLRLPALNWVKPAGERGLLELSGTLGPVPRIDRIAVDAAGLQARGDISLTANGTLDRARFDRVQMAGWFDAPVDLIGRGRDQAAQIVINGGQIDLRRANFGDAGGAGGPMSIALERLQISEGIALTSFRGEFNGDGGFSGEFAADVNGDAAVRGTIVPQDGRSAVRIVSEDAGGVIRSAGLLGTAQGGALELTLLPAGQEGGYDGDLNISDLRVKDAPALASLLNAISVIGLLQQLGGQGLSFNEVRASFRIDPDHITVTRSSAVGPGLGISVDGIYTQASRNMDFQGVISPLYLLNGVGSILTRPGEGLIGFNFTLRGPIGDTRVGVNPFSVLTPGMFREIFRRPAPVIE